MRKGIVKVSPRRGIFRFGKNGKLAPRFVGPFQIDKRVGPVAYKLILPQQLSLVHDVFHVSMLRYSKSNLGSGLARCSN